MNRDSGQLNGKRRIRGGGAGRCRHIAGGAMGLDPARATNSCVPA